MISGAIILFAIFAGSYLLIGFIKTILRSKTLIATAMYLGGYAYYNQDWPSVEMTLHSLMGLFNLL